MAVDGDRTVAPALEREVPGIPYARNRDRNTPWIVFGVLLATLGGLGAFLVATTLADRVDVVVAAREIRAGEPLTAGDLRIVAISGGDGARAIAGGRRTELLGSASTTDLEAGAILHPDQIVDVDELARKVVVGAALAPGEYPTAVLLPGQVVQVIGVSGETSFSDDEENYDVLGKATIVSVKALTRSDELLVSIRVEERLAPLISERAQQRRIRLAVVEDPVDDAPSTTSPAPTAPPAATPTTPSPVPAATPTTPSPIPAAPPTTPSPIPAAAPPTSSPIFPTTSLPR